MERSLKPQGDFFDFEADEKKPADEHKIALRSEGIRGKDTCYFYISHGSCFCISQWSLITTWEMNTY